MFKNGDKVSIEISDIGISDRTVDGMLVFEDDNAYLVHNHTNQETWGCEPSSIPLGFSHGWTLCGVEDLQNSEEHMDWMNIRHTKRTSHKGSNLKHNFVWS